MTRQTGGPAWGLPAQGRKSRRAVSDVAVWGRACKGPEAGAGLACSWRHWGHVGPLSEQKETDKEVRSEGAQLTHPRDHALSQRTVSASRKRVKGEAGRPQSRPRLCQSRWARNGPFSSLRGAGGGSRREGSGRCLVLSRPVPVSFKFERRNVTRSSGNL